MDGRPLRVLGRYALYGEIASGGMATVHFGRLLGPVGFSRTVAIKRLHPQFAKDPDFVSMFLDEARLAARVQHPNVVSTVDVVALEDELFLVMDYVEGESLARLLRACRVSGMRLPPRVVASIITGTLYGLHAAHEAKNERGEPLELVHRDVSPQNILVGVDGVARVLDFGIAKAVGRSQITREGQIKGKLSYMPPEQIEGGAIDRRVDVYAAGVVLWEALTAQRLFDGENEGAVLSKIVKNDVPRPSILLPELPRSVDDIVLRAVSRDPSERFPTAWDMAVALEEALGVETPRRVGEIVERMAEEAILRRTARRKTLESVHTDMSAMVTASSVLAGPMASGPTPTRPPDEDKTERRRPSRSILVALAIMAGLGATTALALLAVIGTRQTPATAASSPTGAAPPRESAPAEPQSAIAVEPTAAAPSSDPTAVSSAAPVGTPPVGTPPVGTAVAPRPTGPRPTATSAPKPKVDCDPPYVIVDGIRKLKPECI